MRQGTISIQKPRRTGCFFPCRRSCRVWVREVVLPQQVLAVIISIRSSHNAMNVLLSRLQRVSCKLLQVCGPLVIKFNQDHWTLHAVIKHAIRLLLPVFEKFRMACLRCASDSAFNISRPSFCSFCRISRPLYLPDGAFTGSEPINKGVITTWSPSTK